MTVHSANTRDRNLDQFVQPVEGIRVIGTFDPKTGRTIPRSGDEGGGDDVGVIDRRPHPESG